MERGIRRLKDISDVSVPLRGNGCETPWMKYVRQHVKRLSEVSVPLRGNGCETQAEISRRKAEFQRVSVPLRGNGCETTDLEKNLARHQSLEFPSPCGVMGVKLPAIAGGGSVEFQCFRPLAG
jgi:hypothetical protein